MKTFKEILQNKKLTESSYSLPTLDKQQISEVLERAFNQCVILSDASGLTKEQEKDLFKALKQFIIIQVNKYF